jgi:cell division protein FtsW (lipid II flippase)
LNSTSTNFVRYARPSAAERWRTMGSIWLISVAVLVLCLAGLAAISSVSLDEARSQAIYLVIGIFIFWLVQGTPYRRLGIWAWGFYFFCLLLLIYMMIAPEKRGFLCVPRINGYRSWIDLKITTLQPAELTKIGFIMVLARYLRFRSNYRSVIGLLPPMALAVTPILLIIQQQDLGTCLTFIPALFAVLFVAGAKWRHLLFLICLGIILAPVAWLAGPARSGGPDKPFFRHLPTLVRPNQRARVIAMFSHDPRTLNESGFQQQKALIALGSGGFRGKGMGHVPIGKTVPEAQNDMVLSLVGEQFGFLGVVAVILCYCILFACALEIAGNTKDPFGRLLVVGLISILAGETFLNLMVTTRLMPVTGLTLPFVSYGGSSLLTCFISLGLIVSVSRHRPLMVGPEAFEFSGG